MKAIEIDDTPELLRVAEEVHRSHEPRVLRRQGEDLAMVVPLPLTEKAQGTKPTAEDLAAFRRAAGSWADIDTEALKEFICRAREEGTRPTNRP